MVKTMIFNYVKSYFFVRFLSFVMSDRLAVIGNDAHSITPRVTFFLSH